MRPLFDRLAPTPDRVVERILLRVGLLLKHAPSSTLWLHFDFVPPKCIVICQSSVAK